MSTAPLPAWSKPLLLLLGVAGLAVTIHELSGNHLTELAHRGGASGIALFVLLGACACACGLPRQLVASAAAASYGLWAGLLVALLAQMLGCAADFYWARFIGRHWARQRIAGRLARLHDFLTSHPFSATPMLRLFPVGNNLMLNLLAGVSGMGAAAFLSASLIGYLPQTLVFALVGTGHAVHLSLGAALFAASTLMGLWLAKRHRELS